MEAFDRTTAMLAPRTESLVMALRLMSLGVRERHH